MYIFVYKNIFFEIILRIYILIYNIVFSLTDGGKYFYLIKTD